MNSKLRTQNSKLKTPTANGPTGTGTDQGHATKARSTRRGQALNLSPLFRLRVRIFAAPFSAVLRSSFFVLNSARLCHSQLPELVLDRVLQSLFERTHGKPEILPRLGAGPDPARAGHQPEGFGCDRKLKGTALGNARNGRRR